MGSRGVPHYPSFQNLAMATKIFREKKSHLIGDAVIAVLRESLVLQKPADYLHVT